MSLIKDWGHLPRVGSGCGGQENVFASSKLLRLYYVCLCVTVCKTTPLSSSNFKTPVLPLPFGGGAAPVQDRGSLCSRYAWSVRERGRCVGTRHSHFQRAIQDSGRYLNVFPFSQLRGGRGGRNKKEKACRGMLETCHVLRMPGTWQEKPPSAHW